MTKTEALKERLAQVDDLRHLAHLAHWDQQTMMPPNGARARAEALGTLEQITHELFVSDETGRLLDAAASECEGADYDSDDASLIRFTRREWDKARRVPAELAAEVARAASLGHEAWVKAREESDFSQFAPALEHNLDLSRRYVDCFSGSDGFECAYDVLLDDYEPLMKTSAVAALFADLKSELMELIGELRDQGEDVDASMLRRAVPVERQRALAEETVALMGFNRQGWRLDDTVHPFAVGVGGGDVRITTRWDENYFPMSLYGAMHECGHGLYEAGVADSLRRSPLGHGTSLGVHESQSRLWENMVGRSAAFSNVLAERMRSTFGWSEEEVDPTSLFRAVNRVEPSLIRVEADETTYSLHIIMRFEFEQELIDGRLAVADLPEAWNARMREYLGVEVPDDARGVLQDVHWAGGLIGYFPTYALGNLVAGALWERANNDVPDLEAEIGQGNLGPLREWLVDHVHRHGSKFTTAELLERETGNPIGTQAFTGYLRRKLSGVYSLRAAA